jgi:hypothetical protein
LNGLLQSDNNSSITVRIDPEDFKARLFVYIGVIAARLTILLSTLLEINAFNKLFKVGLDLWSGFFLYLGESVKLADRSRSLNI